MNAKNPYKKSKTLPIKKNKGLKFSILFSRKVLLLFPNAKKKLVIIKNGDHSLSSQISLKKITKELKRVVEDIV